MRQILIVSFIISLMVILTALVFLDVSVHKALNKCQNSEGYKCPVYKGAYPDEKCSYAAFRCLAFDSTSSNCSGDNKICQTYDVTDGLLTKSSSKN